MELDTPLFEIIDEEDFVEPKNIISKASSLHWITSLNNSAQALSLVLLTEYAMKWLQRNHVRYRSWNLPIELCNFIRGVLHPQFRTLNSSKSAEDCNVVENGRR